MGLHETKGELQGQEGVAIVWWYPYVPIMVGITHEQSLLIQDRCCQSWSSQLESWRPFELLHSQTVAQLDDYPPVYLLETHLPLNVFFWIPMIRKHAIHVQRSILEVIVSHIYLMKTYENYHYAFNPLTGITPWWLNSLLWKIVFQNDS